MHLERAFLSPDHRGLRLIDQRLGFLIGPTLLLRKRLLIGSPIAPASNDLKAVRRPLSCLLSRKSGQELLVLKFTGFGPFRTPRSFGLSAKIETSAHGRRGCLAGLWPDGRSADSFKALCRGRRLYANDFRI